MTKIVHFLCKNQITKYFAANLASNSFVKFATDLIATELLANLNNKIVKFSPGYLWNLLRIALVVDFDAKFNYKFSYRKQNLRIQLQETKLQILLQKLFADLAAKLLADLATKNKPADLAANLICGFSCRK